MNSPHPSPLTSRPLSSVLDTLHGQSALWFSQSSAYKVSLLKRMLKRAQTLSFDAWGEITSTQNGHDITTAHGQLQQGFDMLSGSSVILTLIQETIERLSSARPLYKRARPSRDGRHYRLVSPVRLSDQLKPTRTLRAEIWSRDELPEEPLSPGVCMVLGAGNQPFLAVGDVMYQLFVSQRCCLLKHHPLRVEQHEFLVELFQDLIEEGVFACLSLDLEETRAAIHDERVSAIHMTGGASTHDRIDPEARKLTGAPLLDKPMTSELGCVTPWIICPGAWSEAQLWRQAGQLAFALCYNDSFNCLAPKVVLLDHDWPQREPFLSCLREILSNTLRPASYYPGAQRRYDDFLAAYAEGEVEIIESDEAPKVIDAPSLPWTLIHLRDHDRDYAFKNEAFAPILALYSIESQSDTASFLERAAQLCNEEIWGDLSCTVLIDDHTASTHSEALDRCVHELRYGAVGVNVWTTQVYALTRCSWGGYPGNSLRDVSSGIGVVNNTYGVPRVEKSVIYARFEDPNQLFSSPRGELSVSAQMCRDIVSVLQRPNLRNVLRLIWRQLVG